MCKVLASDQTEIVQENSTPSVYYRVYVLLASTQTEIILLCI